MPIQHVLAVVPVTDIVRANSFYESLFGRPADNTPMATLVEWRVTDGGWVQVTVDEGRAGGGQLNLAAEPLEATREELIGRGLTPGDVLRADKGVELSALEDPDGNVVTLIGGFREVY